MSKDKGCKAHKKGPATNGKKTMSDYQASKTEVVSANKTHN